MMKKLNAKSYGWFLALFLLCSPTARATSIEERLTTSEKSLIEFDELPTSPWEEETWRSLDKANIPKDVIRVVVIYAGYSIERALFFAGMLSEKCDELKNEVFTPTTEEQLRRKIAFNQIMMGKLAIEAKRWRFWAIKRMEEMNSDQTSNWSRILAPNLSMLEQATEESALVTKYSRIMHRHRSWDVNHWECLEDIVGFILLTKEDIEDIKSRFKQELLSQVDYWKKRGFIFKINPHGDFFTGENCLVLMPKKKPIFSKETLIIRQIVGWRNRCGTNITYFLMPHMLLENRSGDQEMNVTTPQAIFNWVSQQGSSLWASVKSFWG